MKDSDQRPRVEGESSSPHGFIKDVLSEFRNPEVVSHFWKLEEYLLSEVVSRLDVYEPVLESGRRTSFSRRWPHSFDKRMPLVDPMADRQVVCRPRTDDGGYLEFIAEKLACSLSPNFFGVTMKYLEEDVDSPEQLLHEVTLRMSRDYSYDYQANFSARVSTWELSREEFMRRAREADYPINRETPPYDIGACTDVFSIRGFDHLRYYSQDSEDPLDGDEVLVEEILNEAWFPLSSGAILNKEARQKRRWTGTIQQ